MIVAQIFGVVLVLVLIIIAIAYLVSSRSISVEDLRAQGRVKEIIEILNKEQAPLPRRTEALEALISLATLEAQAALLERLSHRSDALFPVLVNKIGEGGSTFYPILRKAFLKPQSRHGALRAMLIVGPKSMDVLSPFLNSADPALRQACLETLPKLGWKPGKDADSAAYWIAMKQPRSCIEIGSAAVPALVEALKDTELCEEVIAVLGELREPSAGWPLLNLSKDSQYTQLVIKAISRWKDAALPLLLSAMEGQDSKIQQTVVIILDWIYWNPTPDVTGARYWAIRRRWNKCVEIGGNAAIGPLVEALQEEDPKVRKEVVAALGSLGSEKALEKLLMVLKDTDSEVRQETAAALRRFSSPRAIQALIELLENDELYQTSQSSLVAIGAPALESLKAVLRTSDTKVRQRAAEALDSGGWKPVTDLDQVSYWIACQDWDSCAKLGPVGVEWLVQELNHPQNCVKAAESLVQIGDARAIEPIINAMDGKPPGMQKILAEALGKVGPQAVEPLLTALAHGQIETIPAVQALGAIGDGRAAQPLTAFLHANHPPSEREAAALALGKIGAPAVEPIFEAMRGLGLDPRATGIALGGAAQDSCEQLVEALKSKIYDAQVLVYALGKIPTKAAAQAVLTTLQGDLYGQEIRATAENALLEIGGASIDPLIGELIKYTSNPAQIGSLLVRFGTQATNPLIRALKTCVHPAQTEVIANVLGEVGDIRAVSPLVDLLKNKAINPKVVNNALGKIWQKQREDKEKSE